MSKEDRERKIAARLISEPDPEAKDSSSLMHRNRVASRGEKKAHYATNANYTEESLIEALDAKRDIEKLAEVFTRLNEGKIDMQGLLQEMSPRLIKETLLMALNGDSEKNRLDAQKHIQALAGLVPVTKQAIVTVDATQSKEALISQLMGTKKALEKEGIVIVDDDVEEVKKDEPNHDQEK